VNDAERPPVLAAQRFAAERASFAGLDLAGRFAHIDATNLWGAATTTAGLGSERSATAAIRDALPALIRTLGIRSLLDAPCGDAAWLDPGVPCIGVDIVPAIVARRSKAGVDSRIADITTDALPLADAVLCRDCLVHLSFANIARAVANFRRSGATWLITTTFTNWQVNRDCDDGDWRALNFERAPFYWPPPLAVLDEACTEAGGGWRDKALGVWRLGALVSAPPYR